MLLDMLDDLEVPSLAMPTDALPWEEWFSTSCQQIPLGLSASQASTKGEDENSFVRSVYSTDTNL